MFKGYDLVHIPEKLDERLALMRGYKRKNVLIQNSDLIVPFNNQLIGGKISKVEKDGQTGFYYLEKHKFNVAYLQQLWVENSSFRREWNENKKRARQELSNLTKNFRSSMSR